MGVDVDEAGRHQRAVGVDSAPRVAADGTDLHDLVAVDREIARKSGFARPVDDRAAADYYVMGHVENVALRKAPVT